MEIVLLSQSFMAVLVPNIYVIYASMVHLLYYFVERFVV